MRLHLAWLERMLQAAYQANLENIEHFSKSLEEPLETPSLDDFDADGFRAAVDSLNRTKSRADEYWTHAKPSNLSGMEVHLLSLVLDPGHDLRDDSIMYKPNTAELIDSYKTAVVGNITKTPVALARITEDAYFDLEETYLQFAESGRLDVDGLAC